MKKINICLLLRDVVCFESVEMDDNYTRKDIEDYVYRTNDYDPRDISFVFSESDKFQILGDIDVVDSVILR